MDALEKEKLVSKRSIIGLGKIIVRDEERLFEQAKRYVRCCEARFLHAALNTSAALLNTSFSLRGSKPKRFILISVVFHGSGSISFASLLRGKFSFLNKLSLHTSQTVEA